MPSYKTEVTSVIKATAVVGYIAVQDLTKIGDIVRTRTYEAFFPFISVAVIRDLSQAGKTMMIVTHEMNFARAICNRVFYMDQGGIYEERTPDHEEC